MRKGAELTTYDLDVTMVTEGMKLFQTCPMMILIYCAQEVAIFIDKIGQNKSILFQGQRHR